MGQVSAFLRRFKNGYSHWCPACREMHAFAVDAPFENGSKWTFDGNVDCPTFRPSMNISAHDPDDGFTFRCHYILTAGQIQFCGDSTHELRGQTVQLPPLPPHVQD